MRFHPRSQSEWLPSRKQQMLARKMWKEESFFAAHGSINLCSHCESQCGGSSRTSWKPTTVELSQNMYIYKRNLNGITEITKMMRKTKMSTFCHQMKPPVHGMGYIELICWPYGPQENTPKTQAIVKFMGCLLQTDGKTPLLKIPS